jgi:hypothetical protein
LRHFIAITIAVAITAIAIAVAIAIAIAIAVAIAIAIAIVIAIAFAIAIIPFVDFFVSILFLVKGRKAVVAVFGTAPTCAVLTPRQWFRFRRVLTRA